MSKKKVCIIRSNPVRPDSRVEKEAWTLVSAGYDVHVLAWDRDTNCPMCCEYISVADVKIPITRLGYKASYGDGLKNLKAYLAFQFHMRKWLKKNSFNVVHACDFDTAFFSIGIAKRKKEKFIFDIFDFIFGNPQNIFQKCVKKAQIWLINNADATIICTEERKQQVAGSNPKNLLVIHNTPSVQQMQEEVFDLPETNRTRIVYVGILQNYRLLKEIAEAVIKTPEYELHIGGFGKYENYFCEISNKYDNVKFYGRLSYEKTLALEKQCDIMLAIYDPTIENHRFAAPNKFYESLMLGKPVVMVKGTGMSQVVKKNEIGELIDYSKEGFINGINNLILKKDKWDSIEQRMKKLYREQYCWDEMESRLLKMYSSILEEDRFVSEKNDG